MLEQQLAAGKALRDKVSRRSHQDWKPLAHRTDPIEQLIQSNKGRVARLVPIRYGRMMENPLAFLRGAAAIMASDLAKTPASGIRVQICGDCHLMNFGGFATPERHLIFDITDFDETLPAPWEWDVKRLAASFAVSLRQDGFSKADARGVAARCVRSYREHINDFAALGVLERWYTQISTDDLLATLHSRKAKKWVQARIDKASSKAALDDDFPKLTAAGQGKVRIKDNPPLIFHDASVDAATHARTIHQAFRRYCESLADDRRALVNRYEVKDLAAKVVGVGSVGTRCGILLLTAGPDDVLFLQVKEARPSVLEAHAGKSQYTNRGQRIVAGQRLMQAASDIFLGWTQEGGRHFYVRQLRDIKIKPAIEGADVARLEKYAEWCGWSLARAHAKAGDAARISGYLGTSGRFDAAVARFAVAYAEQNERDHAALLTAIRNGRITAIRE